MVTAQAFEKANSCLPSNPRALPEPDDYDRGDVVLTKEVVATINKALAQRLLRYGAVRAHTAFYRCPWPCTPAVFENTQTVAIKKWLRYMELSGWVLVSHVRVAPKTKWVPSHRLRGDWYSVPILDEVEIPIGAAFRKRDLQMMRTEVPVADS